MYNNRDGYFNRSAVFNRSITTAENTFSGTAQIVYSAAADGWLTSITWGDTGINLSIRYQPVNGMLSAVTPLSAVDTMLIYSAVAPLAAYAKFSAVSAGISYSLVADAFRINDAQFIRLASANPQTALWKNGDTVVIDTGSMDIMLNGSPATRAWQVGSEFFQLEKGSNDLVFNVTSTSDLWRIDVVVTYEERWL